jgi:hypothetical protein
MYLSQGMLCPLRMFPVNRLLLIGLLHVAQGNPWSGAVNSQGSRGSDEYDSTEARHVDSLLKSLFEMKVPLAHPLPPRKEQTLDSLFQNSRSSDSLPSLRVIGAETRLGHTHGLTASHPSGPRFEEENHFADLELVEEEPKYNYVKQLRKQMGPHAGIKRE